ncbi:GvpL/GvpF family gas vesicle protein [Pelotomaculum isophthalicicum JI]|uniref:GvpL/GvpF family gas vesicle protein n=1 Tax=Pelotomaculum isophthalicicum JI TaxID=947010 RepID=A0A9X4H4W5_9FIRM|nr:GvpL/GvpF family gas vesicle protein [Pelotomaculum isophthalicicum]MDF9407598.1 GvpL/GvpF family gas vesicle protein [Pelotomaculum isophthalicicum JI]
MALRVDDGGSGLMNQNVAAVSSVARLLVKAELKKMGLEKEILVAAREVLQQAVRDAIRAVLIETAGMKGASDLTVQVDMAEVLRHTSPAAEAQADPKIESPVSPGCHEPLQSQEHAPAAAPTGLYIYGVAAGEDDFEMGVAGVAGCRVYALAAAGLCAVVHDCSTEPYRPDSDEQAKEWLFAHQEVLDRAKERLETILPMGFNTIIHSAARKPQEVLREWLSQECGRLKSMLDRLRGKEEFAIKILVPEEVLKKVALREDSRLQELQRELEGKPEGTRYLYKERLEKAVKDSLEEMAEVYFRKVYRALHRLCADIRVEKTKQGPPGKRMIASLSCLVEKDLVPALSETLAEIKQQEALDIDFTGPWPPYSFVSQPVVPS